MNELSGDELLFFNDFPTLLPLYTKLRAGILARFPDTSLKISKTQISFRGRYLYAMVSLPQRKRKNFPADYLLLSFGLGYAKASPRIWQAVEAYPGRWTHHVPLTDETDLEEELYFWIGEAYEFAQRK